MLSILSLPAHAATIPAGVEAGYLVSSEPAEAVAELPLSDFSVFRFGKQLGFLEEPVWVSLTLGEISRNEVVALVVSPVYMDEIDVYLAADTESPLLSAGDTRRSPPSLDRYGYTMLLGEEYSRQRLLVKLGSKNAIQLAVRITSVEQLASQNALSWSVLAICFATLAVCSIWAILSLRLRFSWLVMWFLLRSVGLAITMLIHQGVLRVVWPGEAMPALSGVHDITALAYITLAQIFDYALLYSVVKRRASVSIFGAIMAFSILKAGLYLTGFSAFSFIVNQVSVVFVLALSGLVLLRHWPQSRSVPARGLALYFTLQAAPVFVLFVVSYIVTSAPPIFQEVIFSVYGVFIAGFIASVLHSRQQSAEQENLRMLQRNRELELRAEMEASKRSETANLMRMLAHEIKTPLATLQIAVALDDLSKHRVQSSVDAMVHVLEQCDKLEEVQQGSAFSEQSRLDLCALTREIAQRLQVKTEWLSHSLSSAMVVANLDALSVVITNLLANASKHRSEEAPAALSVVESRRGLSLTVSNPAVLDKPDEIDSLFAKYRRDKSSSGKPGTGLGLSIVKALTAHLGGEIALSYRDGLFNAQLILPAPDLNEASSPVAMLEPA